MFEVHQKLIINSRHFRIMAHPQLAFLPYGQEGRMATVYKLCEETNNQGHSTGSECLSGREWALKVFREMYRSPEVEAISESLRSLATLPGLEAAERMIISPHRREHEDLLRHFPDLAYAALMPWIEGQTWADVLQGKVAVSSQESWSRAKALLEVLFALEENQVAHCDLGSANLIFQERGGRVKAALVDLEQVYAPHLAHPPQHIPIGTPGYTPNYIHDNRSIWGPFGDRFAGAVLLAEILAWHDEEVRAQAREDQSYFSEGELHKRGERFEIVSRVLEAWDESLSELFQRAWFASSLEECPSFQEWFAAFEERTERQLKTQESLNAIDERLLSQTAGFSQETTVAPSIDLTESPISSENLQTASIITLEENSSSIAEQIVKQVEIGGKMEKEIIEETDPHVLWQRARRFKEDRDVERSVREYQRAIELAIDSGFSRLRDLLQEYNFFVFEQIDAIAKNRGGLERAEMRSVSWGHRVGYWLGGLSQAQIVGLVTAVAVLSYLMLRWGASLGRSSVMLSFLSMGTFALAFFFSAFRRPPLVLGLFGAAVAFGLLGSSGSGVATTFVIPWIIGLAGAFVISKGAELLELDFRQNVTADLLWTVIIATLTGMAVEDSAYQAWYKFSHGEAYFLNALLGMGGWYLGRLAQDIFIAYRERSLEGAMK